MEKLKPLFLVLRGTQSAETLARLQREGYLPIEVQSFDEIKVVEPIQITLTDPIARAAFEVIQNLDYDQARTRFGRKISSLFSGSKQ